MASESIAPSPSASWAIDSETVRARGIIFKYFEVNRDRRTRCTNSWSNLTLKCNAYTFLRVDTRIEENCRRTISYLQGYSCPKLQLQETE